MPEATLLTIGQAALALGIAQATLRDRVTAGKVPHLRLHAVRGVRFTQEHIRQIQASREVPVGTTFGRTAPGATGALPPSPPGDALAQFRGLRSLRG